MIDQTLQKVAQLLGHLGIQLTRCYLVSSDYCHNGPGKHLFVLGLFRAALSFETDLIAINPFLVTYQESR